MVSTGRGSVSAKDYDVQVGAMREALARSLPRGGWVVGELADGRACLVLDGDVWSGGFVERGSFGERFRKGSFDEASDMFTTWVESMDRCTRLGAEATTTWLARHRPAPP